jgi:uncharacterized protein DUF3800
VSIPLIAFDESGNTGQNLLDPDQPIFALASVRLTEAEAKALLADAAPKGATEAKFTRLRSSREGRERLASLLKSPLLPLDAVRLAVFHKPFMVTTKIVDLLVEPFLYERGVNLYEKRGNLALANILHVVTPPFCGEKEYRVLLDRFVVMVRDHSPQSLKAFYDHVSHLRAINKHPPFDRDLRLLADTREVAEAGTFAPDITALDPAVPGFFDLAAQWTAQLQGPFDVVHDSSKPLAREREKLELVMSADQPAQVFAGAGPRRQLPLLSTGIRFADSAAVPQIQVADLIAGATAAYCGALVKRETSPLVGVLAATQLPAMIEVADPVWPTAAVPPDELGAGDDGEALRVTMEIVARERIRRGLTG